MVGLDPWYSCAVVIPGIHSKLVTLALNTIVFVAAPAVSVFTSQGDFLEWGNAVVSTSRREAQARLWIVRAPYCSFMPV